MKIHTKSNIAPLLADISKLKIALADAIRRPMGVIPASAEGLLTQAELDAAEDRRAAETQAKLEQKRPGLANDF